MEAKRDDRPFPTYAMFLVGGTAGVGAAVCLHPMDLLKTRMQIAGSGARKKHYKSSVDALRKIVKTEGSLALYSGVTACAARQSIYATVRFGVYTTLISFFTHDGQHPSFAKKAFIGMISGGCGAIFGIPLGLCMVRMMADGGRPADTRFNYKHVFDAVLRIAKEEKGIKGLYRGGFAAFIRALVVNSTSLTTYSEVKEILFAHGYKEEDFELHLIASLISGLITSTISSPFDIIKTRIQAQKDGEPKLTIRQVFWGILTNEGPRSFWKGLTPYFMRITPMTALTFMFVEKLTYWYHIYVLGNKHPTSNL